jgi:hypothetical protein
MKKLNTFHSKIIVTALLVAMIGNFQKTMAQEEENQAISVYQYRKVDPDKMNEFLERETKYWSKVAEKAMDEGKTTHKAWGNARILSPTGEEIKYNTISFDVYPSLKEALDPTWPNDMQAPDMTRIVEAEGNKRASVVYRIVQVVNSN